jgi:SAM-dependent methyltransferase
MLVNAKNETSKTRVASVSREERATASMLARGQRENYASAANLVKRQALFDFPDPERSSGSPVLEHVAWTGTERVLDAGCGNGMWIREVSERFGVRSVVGLDLSLGMLHDTRRMLGPGAPLVAGDIQRLPFPDASFDVILCFWMLYHVPDHQEALEECRRVLRPGGHVLATANDTASRPFDDVLSSALATVTGRSEERWLPPPSFSAENGADILRRVFPRVQEQRTVAAFALPHAEPLLAAMESVRGPVEIFLGEAVDWSAVEGVARSMIEGAIAREGVFRTANASASFLATK